MAGESRATARRIEHGLERLVLASRWLQAPLYIGLIVVLGVVVVKFPFKIWELLVKALTVDEADLVLAVLSLVDLIMVANLVVMALMLTYIDRLAATKQIESGR